jgi:hypothetical protein
MILRALGTFGFSLTVLMMPVLSNAQGVVVGGTAPENRITISTMRAIAGGPHNLAGFRCITVAMRYPLLARPKP